MVTRQTPKTETKTVSEVRKTLTLNRVYRGETRVLVKKNGSPVGGIVSMRDLEALERIEENRRLTLEAFGGLQGVCWHSGRRDRARNRKGYRRGGRGEPTSEGTG